jgi:hypothetical protein
MKRTPLLISAALTAFVLVIIGGIVAIVSQNTAATPAAPVTTTETFVQQTQPDNQGANPPTAQVQQVQAPTLPVATTPALYTVDDQAASAIAESVVPTNMSPLSTPELVNFEGKIAYEVIFDQGNVYVDADTGDVLYNGVIATQSIPVVQTSNPNQPFVNNAPQVPQSPYVERGVREHDDDDDDDHERREHEDDDDDDDERREHEDDD